MNILVCIKQVPDMESRFKVSGSGTWYEETDLAFRMNEYDEYAVEQAVQLKEKTGDGTLTVVSLGPERAKEAIKKALAMGADKGIHINDSDYHQKDSRQIATAIHNAVQGETFDAVFAGLQSQDRGSGQMGIYLARLLGIPCVTTIVGFEYADGVATVRRELDGGKKAVMKATLPALFTCQLGLNTPRYPTLPNIMKAKKKPIDVVTSDGLPAALVTTEAMALPVKKGGAQIIEGDVAEVAEKLAAILRDKAGR